MKLLAEPFASKFAPIFPNIAPYPVDAAAKPLTLIDLAVAPDKPAPALFSSPKELSLVMSVVFSDYELSKSMHLILLEHARKLKPLPFIIYFTKPPNTIRLVIVPLPHKNITVSVFEAP